MSKPNSILIIEDDADVLRAARIALLPYAGHIEEEISTDNLEGLLTKTEFDVVLLDMNFVAGERTGREGLNALARIQSFDPAVAVVLMTAYGAVSLAVAALKQGAADFLLKPWRNDKLIAAVTTAAELTRARRAGQSLQLDAVERKTIEQALARHEGNISLAAATLGLSRAALYRRMSKHGI